MPPSPFLHSMRTSITRLRFAFLALILCLSACGNVPSKPSTAYDGKELFASVRHGADYFPGHAKFYSYGTSQSKENFVNIKRAQSAYSLYETQRGWQDIGTVRAPYSISLLQGYFPLHVRWELKDGRQFIAENIDVRAAMKEYFKTHDIQLQWQREGRPYRREGDYDPSFVHEVKDDTVILKWLITILKTPPEERFSKTGIAPLWKFEYEEHIVTTIKGTPTSGIDFENWYENRKKQGASQ